MVHKKNRAFKLGKFPIFSRIEFQKYFKNYHGSPFLHMENSRVFQGLNFINISKNIMETFFQCRTFQYEKGKHQPAPDYKTIPTQFALTCDRAWINLLMTSINRGGYMIGALLSTWLVKYVGLRDPLMVILFINGLIFISLGFTTDIMADQMNGIPFHENLILSNFILYFFRLK